MTDPSVVAHEGLTFANPLAEADVDAAIDALALPDGARVLETGCGSAELLIRVLERFPTASGVGVDTNGEWLAQARAAADERIPGRELQLVEAAAEDAALEPQSFDAVVNVASSHAHGGYPGALVALRALVRERGMLLLGEGFWAKPPSPAFLDALGGATADELGTRDELLAYARAAGLQPELQFIASQADWARYEETLTATAERRGADEYARRIRERRALPGGGDTLAFALLVLRAVTP